MPSLPKAGVALPLSFPATTGDDVCLADVPGTNALIVYPWTGRPGPPNPRTGNVIPGAHGSTPELEGFRDLASAFAQLESDCLASVGRQATINARCPRGFDSRCRS